MILKAEEGDTGKVVMLIEAMGLCVKLIVDIQVGGGTS